MKKAIDPHKTVIFFDFDNTIATGDVLDDIIISFSRDKRWMELEEKWKKGKIGSKECLAGQLEGLDITKRGLDSYLGQAKLDPYFKRLLHLFCAKGAKGIVLSDNFDYIVRRILSRHRVLGQIKVYSNGLRFEKGRLRSFFPYQSRKCPLCGHCKTKNLLANSRKDSIIIYVGDGKSDICPAGYADIVFAKENLLKHYRESRIACLPYKTLKDVYNYLKRSFL